MGMELVPKTSENFTSCLPKKISLNSSTVKASRLIPCSMFSTQVEVYGMAWHVYVNVTVTLEDRHFVSDLIYDSRLTNVKDARLFCFMLNSITDIENVGLSF
jgi:hypothetical protein